MKEENWKERYEAAVAEQSRIVEAYERTIQKKVLTFIYRMVDSQGETHIRFHVEGESPEIFDEYRDPKNLQIAEELTRVLLGIQKLLVEGKVAEDSRKLVSELYVEGCRAEGMPLKELLWDASSALEDALDQKITRVKIQK